MQRLDLPPQKIQPPVQPRMPLRPRRVVIKMTVMTLRKNSNAVDMRRLHPRRKPPRVKSRPHIRNRRTRVKIEMNLPRAKRAHHRSRLSLLPIPRSAKFNASTFDASRFASATSMICFWNKSVKC